MAGSPKKRAKRLAQSNTDWASVKDGSWATTSGNSIHKVDPRGGKVLYARRDVGTPRPTWYDTLPEAKTGKGLYLAIPSAKVAKVETAARGAFPAL